MEPGPPAADDAGPHPWWPPDPDTIALPIVCRPSLGLWLTAVLFAVGIGFALWLAVTSPWPGERESLLLGARIPFAVISIVIGWVFIRMRRYLRTTTIDRGEVSIRPWIGGHTTRLRLADFDYLDVSAAEQPPVVEFGSAGGERHGLSATFDSRFREAFAALRAFVVPRIAYELGERIEAGETVTLPMRSIFSARDEKAPSSFVKVDARAIRAHYPAEAIDMRWSDVTGYAVLSESAGVLTSRQGELRIDRYLSNRSSLLALLPALTAAAGLDQSVAGAVANGRDRNLRALRARTRSALRSCLALAVVLAIPSGLALGRFRTLARQYDTLAAAAGPSLGVIGGYEAHRVYAVVEVDRRSESGAFRFSDLVLPGSVARGDSVPVLVDGPPPRHGALTNSALSPANRGRLLLHLFGPPLGLVLGLPMLVLVLHGLARRPVGRRS